MAPGYDVRAPKRAVNLSLNEDLVRQARELAGNLSERVESLLAEYVAAELRARADKERRLDETISAWNAFDAKHGSIVDEYNDF